MKHEKSSLMIDYTYQKSSAWKLWFKIVVLAVGVSNTILMLSFLLAIWFTDSILLYEPNHYILGVEILLLAVVALAAPKVIFPLLYNWEKNEMR